MIHKTFGQFDRLVAAQDEKGVLINLLVGAGITARGAWGEAALTMRTQLPWEGRCEIAVDRADEPFLLRLRVPAWAEGARVTLNGQPLPPPENGYAQAEVRAGDLLAFSDPMPARRVQAHPYVRADRGRVALARGPMVYCLEGVDNRFGGRVDSEELCLPVTTGGVLPCGASGRWQRG